MLADEPEDAPSARRLGLIADLEPGDTASPAFEESPAIRAIGRHVKPTAYHVMEGGPARPG